MSRVFYSVILNKIEYFVSSAERRILRGSSTFAVSKNQTFFFAYFESRNYKEHAL